MTGEVDEHGYLLWEVAQPRIEAGATVHASIGGPGADTLCGITHSGPIALDLTHPEAGPHRHRVDCPACLEWMHA